MSIKPNLKVIITGATGMVGEGVLHECLNSPAVAEVLILGRKSYGLSHPKLKELLHSNFHNITSIAEQLTGYDACFFCAGVSSVGKKEEEFYHLTYTLTTHVATVLAQQNPAMTFCYVSGRGTDSSEQGKLMWARVKGKTENDLTKLPFAQVYNFRPGVIEPGKGMKNTVKLYNYLGWLLPVIKLFRLDGIVTLKEIGKAMINATTKGYKKSILEVKDIKELVAQ
ncbi:NAD-dependent epimerase/dehydratase family protein [Lacibacter luteus]|uniref:NAD-dependent epimerase/dehydratase family protein n=1 Tax=Lacibacter luteus TaxID=2508719 RepID=A0A4Q1CDJ3_9BACT|nr:NAD-dependent epimerase/dehydratase family protein [Lacibacter luteus]RXK57715.1 NAD-dependent epimerase/dehydratase family protein [Lacibacter luteus]